MKLKFTDPKLIAILLLFITTVLYITLTSLSLIDNNTAKFITTMQSDDVKEQFNSKLDLLKATSQSLANNNLIVETLQKVNEEGYTQEDIDLISYNIHNFIHIMTNLSFIRSISIASIPGEFIVSDDQFVEGYYLDERPWFSQEMLYSDEAIVTDIYGNFLGNILTCTVAKFIHDPVTGEPIGVVLLNISADSLIYELDREFRIANLDIFLEYADGTLYTLNDELRYTPGEIDYDELYKNKNFEIVSWPILNDNVMCVLAVDLNSLKANDFMQRNSTFVIAIILALTFGISIIILVGLYFLLKPVFSAIGSLVHIIEELGEDYPEKNMGISKVAHMARFIEQSLPKKIKYLIYYDELTGLPNRKMFKSIYRNFTTTTKPFVTMLLDIKNFKGINDTFGDDTGDLVLIDIGLRLTQALMGTAGFVIRYSGDEFLILVESQQVENNIGEFFESNILPRFEEPFCYNDKNAIQVEFNSVAVVSPIHCGTEDDMITKIYVMLKQCKELNTQRLYLFNNDVYSIYVNEERIKSSLKTTVWDAEFVVNYQPIVDEHMNVKKAEALIRWYSKDIGFVPPDKFIYIAEQSRLIIDLGNWIIERVAKDLQTLFQQGRPIPISINISPIQIMEDDFVSNIKAILGKYDIDYTYICFEITESILIEERAVVKQNIKALQELGIVLALDDFGTGYSSFSYLKEYNLDIIKIDKMFVQNSTTKDYAIIDGISRISQALGMQMILEGIETAEQFQQLKKFGLIQGYYFSKPVVWSEFIKFL